MENKDYFKELFEKAHLIKEMTDERKEELFEAEAKLIEVFNAVGNLKYPVEIKLRTGRLYKVGHPIFTWDDEDDRTTIGVVKQERTKDGTLKWNNGYFPFGKYRGKPDKDTLSYYKDFKEIVEKFKEFLDTRIHKIDRVPRLRIDI
jgi:hypothetical protein